MNISMWIVNMIQALLRVSIMQQQDMVTREHILNKVDPDISMHYHAFVIKGYGAGMVACKKPTLAGSLILGSGEAPPR
jgi:hypothetical protein